MCFGVVARWLEKKEEIELPIELAYMRTAAGGTPSFEEN